MSDRGEVSSASVKHDISRTVRGQALAVGGATAASLLYALAIAPVLFPSYQAAPVPSVGAFIAVAIVAGIIWILAVPDSSTWRDLGEKLGFDVETEPSVKTRASIHLARVIALYVLVVLSVVLLAWSTLTSGGTLVSPFSGALVAIALLSPFIAVGWIAPLVAFGLVMASFWIFSGTLFPIAKDNFSVPDSLVLVSAVVTNGIAIVIAVLVKRGEQRRLKRQRSLALEVAVRDLIESRSYAATHAAIERIRPVGNLSSRQVARIVEAGAKNLQIYNIGTDPDVRRFFHDLLRRPDIRLSDVEQKNFEERFGSAPKRSRATIRSAFDRYLANFTDELDSTPTA